MREGIPRRPTIIDVAAKAGVSKSMVSLVMRGSSDVREEKRRLVLEAADALGYRPNAVARSLVRRRTNMLGVVLSDLHNPFFTEVIDGIEAEAEDRSYRTIICTASRQSSAERRALDTLLELRADALILASPMIEMDAIARASAEVPVVLVARPSDSEAIDSVANDDPTGAALVVDHLVALGHRRIAHVDGGGGAGAAARSAGYVQAMQRHGLDAHVRVIPGSYTDEGGRQGVAALLASGERPTAIFVANDLAALGAMSELAERGLRVPDDMSLVGYDNTSLAAVRHISLTTVDQPRPQMGRQAVTLVLERLTRDRTTSRHILIPPRLVVRGTTAAPAVR
ncbi:LacI family DNA-binding transcriptional regulator [Roseisolibacter agri]|uniref:LacI family transcriptional regulator n=1 Tax=Roseisolibacter agri TaxID=2014610 RepID=A0AA37V6C3_9BACT|nr:LacI family DNA-binding transcriptional regulator [Roseisolibacter agri]GLC25136.1 LacI family transcriptional regulator [Roseisolibacter agri]